MKIASITVYCNESFRLDSWYKYYKEYADVLHKHIIINNGEEEDTKLLLRKFPGSIVQYSKQRALTVAYNLGIKLAMADEEVDSIMLIGNDIKINSVNIIKLHEFLFSEKVLGMVAPIILKKDSDIIEVHGAKINPSNLKFQHCYSGKLLNEITDKKQISDSVPGGMNLAKISFYKKLGLQDEKLFMYSDEIDTGIKAKKKGLLIASTIDSVAWHQHVDKSEFQVRSPLAGYLKARNSVYLAHKHCNFLVIMNTFCSMFIEGVRINLSAWIGNKSKDHKRYTYNFLLGAFAGLFNSVQIPKRLL